MSEPSDAPDAPAADSGAPPPKPVMSGRRRLAVWLGAALLLVILLVATASLWTPLVPQAAAPDAALAARFDRLDQAQQRAAQEAAAANAAVQRLERRLAALDAKPVAAASDIAELRQQIVKLADTEAELAHRIDALDKPGRAEAAGDATDLALALAVLQIRDAVETGRPFAASYDALVAIAHARPDIAAAAAPLAEPAKSGLASRAVLARRLRELSGAITSAAAPASGGETASDWTDQALARLRSLVTIRRIDGASPDRPSAGPAAAVNAAELALAGGELEDAVAALEKLTGGPADAARPWLQIAKTRLAAEAALRQLDAMLLARLGSPGGAPAR